MASIDEGKQYVSKWVRKHFPPGSTCLDVGPCDGKWADVLGDWLVMDAVEIFEPNIEAHGLRDKYRQVLCGDIANCVYNWYDLIIFGDVIEHMSVEAAQQVLTYASPRCTDMIVAVPFLYPQEALYGNPWERHVQDDLTPEVFAQRYPGFQALMNVADRYAYYVKDRAGAFDGRRPTFSVIVPTHNGEDRLPVSLRSVRNQTYTDYELIVVCDSCADGSAEVARGMGAQVIEVDCHRDGLARNAGLDAATGEWVLFLDDDDWFLHEYCFERLAQYIRDNGGDVDVINFSFIWKYHGYCVPSPAQLHSMVWCRCWNRAFFEGRRFIASIYGSDSEFFNRHLIGNPACRMRFWDFPMYYYHVREGSLSAMNAKRELYKLDVVITHRDEPWEIGKKLFDSIEIQQCARLEHVHFMLIQDGEDGALPWDELLAGYSYHVDVKTNLDRCGVAAARNLGINCAVSDWIMFMDFDDIVADVATFSMLLRLFPVTDGVDIIHSKYSREGVDYGRFRDTVIHVEENLDCRMIGKLYRVDFLREHVVQFIGLYPEYCDFMFNALALAETYPHRIAQFKAPFYPFFKKFRRDGAFSTENTLRAKIQNRFARDVLLAAEMNRREKGPRCKQWIVRTVADAYHTIRNAELEPDERHGITDDLILFWLDNREFFGEISKTDVEVYVDESETETISFIQEYYNNFGAEYYLQNDMMSFEQFIQELDRLTDEAVCKAMVVKEPEPAVVPADEIPVVELRPQRAVVYCGTKETYINMLASVKSLLCTTPVDKVFFLIEDDEFPYELPDIVETRNVSGLDIFDTAGPNYNNVWTYMCLMRTAFPQMFPEYDRILSLDIDVVITEDVSDLWDIDLTDCYFAGVPEEGRVRMGSDDVYMNFGVIMMNLAKLRADGLDRKLVEAVNTEHFGCPEQDCFNKYCKGHIYRLPNDYNVTPYSHITGEALHEKILHYAGLKYWKH